MGNNIACGKRSINIQENRSQKSRRVLSGKGCIGNGRACAGLVEELPEGKSFEDVLTFFDEWIEGGPDHHDNAIQDAFVGNDPDQRTRVSTSFMRGSGWFDDEQKTLLKAYCNAYVQACTKWMGVAGVVETARGLPALVPQACEANDYVCILYGCSWPIALRKIESHYMLIGPCWITGLMDGEGIQLLETGEVKPQLFDIR